MVSDQKGTGSDSQTEQGIHFHVAITPAEFNYIRNSLSKVFENKIENIAIISHRKYYLEFDNITPFTDNNLYDFLLKLGRERKYYLSDEILLYDAYPERSYFFLRDNDLEFGVLEIIWYKGFDITTNSTKIIQTLIQIFQKLKNQVFQLYFENLYPLLMSRIHTLEQEIIEKEKSELAVDLIEGIAHSIANPLSIIFANLEITEEIITKNPNVRFEIESNSHVLKVDRNEFEELRSIFDDQKEAVKRITNVISELRIFSRAYKEEIENVDLNNVIKLSLNFGQLRLKLRDRIVLDLGSTARVYASLFIVSQVMYNILKIIINASNNYSDKIYISTIDGVKKAPPIVSITCIVDKQKCNITQFSFIDNFLQNIPHDSKINIEDGKINVEISFNTYSYLT